MSEEYKPSIWLGSIRLQALSDPEPANGGKFKQTWAVETDHEYNITNLKTDVYSILQNYYEPNFDVKDIFFDFDYIYASKVTVYFVEKIRNEEKIIETSDIVVKKLVQNDVFTLMRIWYPLRGANNHVTTSIDFDIKKNVIEIFQTNVDWDGTGSKRLTHIKLTSDEFQNLLNTAKQIKTLDDFDAIIDKVKNAENNIDEKINEKFDKLLQELVELYGKTKLREILDDKEQVREILTTYALEGE